MRRVGESQVAIQVAYLLPQRVVRHLAVGTLAARWLWSVQRVRHRQEAWLWLHWQVPPVQQPALPERRFPCATGSAR
jgi:hypothetical protein